MDGLMDKWMDK